MKPLSPLPVWYFVAAAVPAVFLLLVMGLLALEYDALPERIPLHVNFEGKADRWGAKSPGTVFGAPLTGLAVIALMLVLVYSMTFRTRDTMPQRALFTGLMAGLNVWLSLLFSLLALGPVLGASAGMPGGPAAFLVAILTPLAILIVVGVKAITAEPSRDETPPQFYHWGGEFYRNANDPAWMVPKRGGLGYTFNLAQPGAWWLGGLLVLVVLLPLALLR